ncbi:MAG: DNA polymerase III subunit delta [Chitinophagales bacterium]|nr:DNA polymerase III subunit delta [Chitinophagales bacterium]
MVLSFQQIVNDIKGGKFSPVYFLAGEESFFIDEIEKMILSTVLQPGEADFNQTILYGKDISDLREVISNCNQYPVFSERRLVILREAQSIARKEQWEILEAYLKNPLTSTVLVILFKHKTLDKRWDVTKKIIANSAYFESVKIKEEELMPWVKRQIEGMGLSISDTNASIISDNIGNNLQRIINELEKISLVLTQGTEISADIIEKYIGVSKDYNVFELSNAIQDFNIAKAVQIIDYFSKNPKSGPLPLVIGTLYSFFSNLWLYYQLSPDERRNDTHLNKVLGGYYRVKGVKSASRYYSAQKSEQAITLLADYDGRSKGIGNKNMNERELMLELVYRLMN